MVDPRPGPLLDDGDLREVLLENASREQVKAVQQYLNESGGRTIESAFAAIGNISTFWPAPAPVQSGQAILMAQLWRFVLLALNDLITPAEMGVLVRPRVLAHRDARAATSSSSGAHTRGPRCHATRLAGVAYQTRQVEPGGTRAATPLWM